MRMENVKFLRNSKHAWMAVNFKRFSRQSTHLFRENVVLIGKHGLKLLIIHFMYKDWVGSTYYRRIKWNLAYFGEIHHKIWHLTASIIMKGIGIALLQ